MPDFVLHTAKTLPAGLHLYDRISGKFPRVRVSSCRSWLILSATQTNLDCSSYCFLVVRVMLVTHHIALLIFLLFATISLFSAGLFPPIFSNNNNNNSIYLYSAIYPELKFCSEALVTTLA